MGVSLKDLVQKKEINIQDLSGKIVSIDAFNMLYQFLTTIRERDGTLLKNSKGEVTSHLTGLFARTTNFLRNGIKPVFVFDGVAPKLKLKERERRENIKLAAEKQYKKALDKQDTDGMKKYAGRTTRLSDDMILQSKEFLDAMGIPYVDAPSEGDAQAAYMVKQGDAYATISQDFDTLLHGSPKLIRNLSNAKKRKKRGTLAYATIKPEIIVLADVLNSLGIDNDQLIALGMLIGTDYNIGGIKGIGPKKGLELVKRFRDNFEGLFAFTGWEFDCTWKEVFDTIKNMPVTDDYTLEWKEPNEQKVISILVDRFEFSLERVESGLKKIVVDKKTKEQTGLGQFF